MEKLPQKVSVYSEFFQEREIKARASRSGLFPCRLLLGCGEISRMQPPGPVYISTLGIQGPGHSIPPITS
jgi:hypothetical protein